MAASQSAISSQEAKDFKVVVAMDNPPDEIRPGLSCTAKITTATRKSPLTIPIQALTVRQKGDLEPKKPDARHQHAGRQTRPRRRKGPQRGSPGRLRRGRREGQLPQSGNWNHRRLPISKCSADSTKATRLSPAPTRWIRTIANDAQVKVDNKVATVQPKS